jgi:hypothetical protein
MHSNRVSWDLSGTWSGSDQKWPLQVARVHLVGRRFQDRVQ